MCDAHEKWREGPEITGEDQCENVCAWQPNISFNSVQVWYLHTLDQRHQRRFWAVLMWRVIKLDLLQCCKCGSSLIQHIPYLSHKCLKGGSFSLIGLEEMSLAPWKGSKAGDSKGRENVSWQRRKWLPNTVLFLFFFSFKEKKLRWGKRCGTWYYRRIETEKKS